MTNIQAAIGYGQLSRFKKIIKKKYSIGNKYYNELKNLKNILLQENKTSKAKNIYWVFGIVLIKKFANQRNLIMKKLLKLGIETRPFFVPMHKQYIFKKLKLFRKIKLKNSEFLSRNGFYLPSGLGIKNSEIKFICKKVNKIFNKYRI